MFKFDCEKYILYNLDHLFPDKITEQAFILTLNFRLAAYFKQCFCKVFPELNIHESWLSINRQCSFYIQEPSMEIK